MDSDLCFRHAEGARILDSPFRLPVAKGIEQGHYFTWRDPLAPAYLERSSVYPCRLLGPLTSEALVDFPGEIEIVNDEGCGQIEHENTGQSQ
jgi:hypothetical protein